MLNDILLTKNNSRFLRFSAPAAVFRNANLLSVPACLRIDNTNALSTNLAYRLPPAMFSLQRHPL